VQQEPRLVFGDVAEVYERVRPSYPDKLVDDVIEFSGIDGSGAALEVGAGTGKATRLFAARGLSVRALEPSPRMAAVARRACSTYENVTVEEREFEQFTPRGRQFRLLFSAQAWHWISPEVRYIRAREALAPGGLLAAFWNRLVRCYEWSCTYSSSVYLELLETHSGHIIRPENERREILDGVGAVIDRNGGSIRLPLVTILCLAIAA
jgi:SAM-dependent methyltransferase